MRFKTDIGQWKLIFSLLNDNRINISGVTMSINVGYSPKMARQYINVQFAPIASFIRKTEGICGFMDDDSSNDLIGPSGEAYKDPIIFTDSCKRFNYLKV